MPGPSGTESPRAEEAASASRLGVRAVSSSVLPPGSRGRPPSPSMTSMTILVWAWVLSSRKKSKSMPACLLQSAGFACAMHERLEGALDLAVVAITVEGDAAANPGDHFPDADLVHLLFEFFEQGWGATGLGAASIKDDVEVDIVQSAFLRQLEQGQRVIDRAV